MTTGQRKSLDQVEQVRERQGEDGSTYWTYDHISQVSSAMAAAQACYFLILNVQVKSNFVLGVLVACFQSSRSATFGSNNAAASATAAATGIVRPCNKSYPHALTSTLALSAYFLLPKI